MFTSNVPRAARRGAPNLGKYCSQQSLVHTGDFRPVVDLFSSCLNSTEFQR